MCYLFIMYKYPIIPAHIVEFIKKKKNWKMISKLNVPCFFRISAFYRNKYLTALKLKFLNHSTVELRE